MEKYFATVHLLINAESEDEACDAVSVLLSENGIYTEKPDLMDWEYVSGKDGWLHAPTAVDVPEDYDRDSGLLVTLDPTKP